MRQVIVNLKGPFPAPGGARFTIGLLAGQLATSPPQIGPQLRDALKIFGLDAIELHLMIRIVDLAQRTRTRNALRFLAKMRSGLF